MTKVLILDQSKSVRNILRERLEYEGFSAEAVENEAAASALCERIPFDVILSDTECKVPDAGIPFIALSADTSIDTAVKAVRNGAQDFLTKPIDMNRLLQSLHRTIDNPAPAQAPLQLLERGRLDEHEVRLGHLLAHLECPLNLDLEDDLASRRHLALHRGARSAVAVAGVLGPFQKAALLRQA